MSGLSNWLVDAVVPTITRVSEEDDVYDWGHPVGDMQWIQWSRVQESHQSWKWRWHQGPGVVAAMYVDRPVKERV